VARKPQGPCQVSERPGPVDRRCDPNPAAETPLQIVVAWPTFAAPFCTAVFSNSISVNSEPNGGTPMSSSALEQDFAESDNLGEAESEEASIDLGEVDLGEPVEGLTATASPEGWEVEGLSGGTPVAEG
jgi:hypothetical protein